MILFKNSRRYLAVWLLACVACNEDTTMVQPEGDTTRILDYQITNVSGDPILGAINEEDHTITVYLPYYYYLTVLVPEITVSDGATVTPESGTLVEDLIDYFMNGRTITYEVTDEDNQTDTYTLDIQVQQLPFYVAELSDDASNPTVYTSTASANLFSIAWSGQTPDPDNEEINSRVIQVTLTETTTGYAYTFANNNNDSGIVPEFTESAARYYLPTEADKLPSGTYTVSVQFYSQQVTLENPIVINQTL